MKAQFDFLGVTFTVHYTFEKGDKGDYEQPPYPDVYEIIKVTINGQDAEQILEYHWANFEDEFTKYMKNND